MPSQSINETLEIDKLNWEYGGEIPVTDWIGEVYKITAEDSQLAVAYHIVNGSIRIEFMGHIAKKIQQITIQPEQCVFTNSTQSIFYNKACSTITIENSLLQQSSMLQTKGKDEDIFYNEIHFSEVLDEIYKINHLSLNAYQALYKIFYLAHELKIQKLISTLSNSKTHIWDWNRVSCGNLLEIPNLSFAINLINNNNNQLSSKYNDWFKKILNFHLYFSEIIKKFFKFQRQYDTKIAAAVLKHKFIDIIFLPEEKISLFKLAIIAYGERIKNWVAWQTLSEQQQQEIKNFFEQKLIDFQFTNIVDITSHIKQLAENKKLIELREICYRIFGGTTELYPNEERTKLYHLLYPKPDEDHELSNEHFTKLVNAFEVYYQQQGQYYRDNGFRENMPLPKYFSIHFNNIKQWANLSDNFGTKQGEIIYITHGGGWHHIQQFIAGDSVGYPLERGGFGIQVTPIIGRNYPKRACYYANRKYIESINCHINMDSPGILFATIQIKYLTKANNGYEAGLKPENVCHLQKFIVIDLHSLQAIAYDHGKKTEYSDAMACLEHLGKEFHEAFIKYQDDVYHMLFRKEILEYYKTIQPISATISKIGIHNSEKDQENPKQELPTEKDETNSCNRQPRIQL